MATIDELNKAIETLISECNTHKMCTTCPMYENCSRIIYDRCCICDWEKIKEGEQDDNKG